MKLPSVRNPRCTLFLKYRFVTWQHGRVIKIRIPPLDFNVARSPLPECQTVDVRLCFVKVNPLSLNRHPHFPYVIVASMVSQHGTLTRFSIAVAVCVYRVRCRRCKLGIVDGFKKKYCAYERAAACVTRSFKVIPILSSPIMNLALAPFMWLIPRSMAVY